ncbi:MAG: hypothetical protein PIR02_11875 [Microbacterium enclense]
MFNDGDTLRTPDGQSGRIASPQTGQRAELFGFGGQAPSARVYTVILASGKVERWTEEALSKVTEAEAG